MDLTGQVWLITGSSGIGAATARKAAAAGARIFVCGLDGQECAELAAELGGAYHAGDLSEPRHAEIAVAQCFSEFGSVDALFNVAGASGRRFGDGPLHLITDEGWDRTIDVNLKSMFLVTRSVLRRMLPREKGAILNMATITATSPEPNYFATHAYAAAKGGVIAMTKAMASYYAPHKIRVNAIAPGLVRTPMSRRAQTDDRILAFMKKKQPLLEGLIEPEDVAEAAMFLLSPAAGTITGEVLSVDAGWHVS
jgi:NAD(P)-dependent dehydrogenase (short-subunit alcohol dehydrogenase family)